MILFSCQIDLGSTSSSSPSCSHSPALWGTAMGEILQHSSPAHLSLPQLWLPGECAKRDWAIHHCQGLRDSGVGGSRCHHLSLTPA